MSNSTPHRVSHRWTIDYTNVNKLFNTQGYPCINSPAFTHISSSTSASSPPQFKLKLYPKGVNDNFKNFLSVGLFSDSFGGQLKCLIRCQFSLIDRERQKRNTKELSCCFSSGEFCSVLDQFIHKSNLINPTNDFVRDDKLTLDCQITILGEPLSVDYFDTFLNHFNFISNSNTNLMMEMYHDLAFQHRCSEFPDFWPVDLQFHVPLEETMNHYSNFDLDFGSSTLNRKSRPAGPYSFMDFSELMSLSHKKTLLDLKFTVDGDKMHCDVVLVVEGKHFRAHKSFLAVQSPIFESMFRNHEQTEKKIFEIQPFLSDVTARVFAQISKYSYSGKVLMDLKIKELLKIADKNIHELLKHKCNECILCNQAITIKTALELLQYSEQLSLCQLKQICVPFVIEMFRNLAHEYQHNEFVDRVALDLPVARVPLEESMSQRTKFTLNFNVPTTDGGLWYIVCADARPALNFRVIRDHYGVSISYLSTSKIFVKFSATFIKNSFKRINHFSSKFPSETNSIYTSVLTINKHGHYTNSSIYGMDISLEMTIFKKSSWKLDITELKSTSRGIILSTLQNMVFWRNHGKHSDVTLLVEDKQFRVHQAILAARSPLFEAMFGHDKKQKFENSISIHDVTADGFEQYLLYLYSGTLYKDTVYNSFQISLKTVLDLMQFSKRHEAVELEQICIKFVVDYCLDAIIFKPFTRKSYHDYLETATKFAPKLMKKIFAHLALQYQPAEFADTVPLGLPLDLSLEETVTHLSFESQISNDEMSDSVCGSFEKFGFLQVTLLSRKETLLNLRSLLESRKRCDVTVFVEGKQFRAHKSILAARSPLFEAIFVRDRKQKFKSQIFITDLNVQVFELLLNYLYTGKVSSTIEIVELMKIPDKYLTHNPEFFNQLCGHFLYDQFSTETVIKLLQLSQRYSLDRLKQLCLSFITDHSLDVIRDDSQWKISSKIEPTLLMEMFGDLALKHRHNEFPDHVQLDLPCLPEETLTHHAKYSLFSTFSLPEGPFAEYTWAVCASDNPTIKFSINWNWFKRPNTLGHSYGVTISYLSTPNIFVDVTITRTNRWMGQAHAGAPGRWRTDLLTEHLSGELTQELNSLRRVECNVMNALGKEIGIEMTIYKESYRESGFPDMKSLSREQILLDLKSMLNGEKHCDVVLLVEGKKFRAHKSILGNRSMVFEAMFRYDWKEKVKNQVEIHDVNVEAFKKFIIYLYTGKLDCSIMVIHAMDLFVLADMHHHSTLAQMCLRGFGQSLTLESVYEQFERADRLGLTEFKQVCATFINKTN